MDAKEIIKVIADNTDIIKIIIDVEKSFKVDCFCCDIEDVEVCNNCLAEKISAKLKNEFVEADNH